MANTGTAAFEATTPPPGGRQSTRVFIAVTLACGIAALVHVGTPAPGISTGDVAPRTIVSRAPFEAANIGETNKRRRKARERALSIYVDESGWRDGIRKTLFTILDAVEAGDSLDDAKSRLRAMGVEIDPRPVWNVLRRTGEMTREELTRPVDGLIDDLTRYGVISDERLEAEARSGRQGIARRTPPAGVRELAFAAPGVKGVLGLDAAQREVASFLLSACEGKEELARVLTSALQQDLRPSLNFNAEGTRAAREEAAKVVPAVRISVPPGEVIVVEGQAVGPTEQEKLLREAEAYYSSRPLRERLMRMAGTVLIVAVLVAVLAWGVARLDPRAFGSTRAVFFIALLNIAVVAVARGLVTAGLPAMLTPVTFAAIVLALAVSPLFGTLSSVALAAVVALAAGPDFALPAALAAGGVTGALTVARSRRRSDLLRAGAVAGIVMFAVISGMKIATGVSDLAVLLRHGGWALLNGVACGFASLGVLPLVEAGFGVTTDISLLELSDQNHPALRRLLTEAPGSYHHCLIVGNLSETASTAVGADALLARVASYYHDLGKVNRPEYFIENEPAGRSRHEGLSPTISALIITSHVRDGVLLGRQYRLPRAIVDVIREHHGTSLVEYFYRTAVERAEGRHVEEHLFRYPGPRPQTREAGIVLIADAIEAASRALEEPTSTRLTKLVRDITMKRLLDGQFDESGLTFNDLRIVRESFVKVLVSMFHTRVPYPEAIETRVGTG